jgi:uncharacterized membrane protein YccF (DUF307 family)
VAVGEAVTERSTVVYKHGPNLLVRFIWWLFIGWWASGIAVAVAWLALITISRYPGSVADVQPDAIHRVAVSLLMKE